MDQQIYDNIKKSEFEKIEVLIPVLFAVFVGFIMLMMYIYTYSIMLFNIALFMLSVIGVSKLLGFFITLWGYPDDNDMP